MLSILGFLAVLGPLVVVHEFGHYLFARLFGVKAEVFSIGFGPIIWKRQMGETELRISAVPLGGFVKLLGEEGDNPLPPELAKRALSRQAPWKRFFIFFGGPLFNFIFAIFVFMAILVIGEPQLSGVVGRVVQGSQAEKVGFQSGDEIVAIDGQPMKRFEDIIMLVSEKAGHPLKIEVERKDMQGQSRRETLSVTPTGEEGFSIYGEKKVLGQIDGLFPVARSTQVGVSNPESLAAKAGFKSGDEVTQINGTEVKDWEQLEKLYRAAPVGAMITIQGKEGEKLAFEKHAGSQTFGTQTGLHSSELIVEKTVPDSPAAKAGLQAGDRLVAIGSTEVKSFFELRDAVQKAGEKDGKVTVRWERAGQMMNATVEPTGTDSRDPALKKTTQFTIGVMPMPSWAERHTFVERVWNPFTLLYKGTERMVVFTYRNVVSLKKMITGDVSVATLGGPILIGKIAGESISQGLIAFLNIMAMLSVGLGVLNVLPIPVLDGGHLLLLAIEAVRGRPLTIRQMEIVQQVGLSLILLLMVIVIRNDLARVFN